MPKKGRVDTGKAIQALKMGVYDGAHHKDWCIQQALKHLYGFNDQEFKDYLSSRDWEEGNRTVNLIPDEHYDAFISAFEWQYRRDVELVNQTLPEKQKCDPGCPGWAVTSEERGMDEVIQRCDICKVFGDDHAALTYVLTRLGNAMERRHRHEIEQQENARG